MKFLLPQGIGDSVWALHKIQSVSKKLGDGKIEAFLNCQDESLDGVESRALDFIKRFSFLDSTNMLQGVSIHPPHRWVDFEGRYIYIDDGPMEFRGEKYFALMPNGPLERGVRLEDWLPEYEINWDIMKDFRITDKEAQRGRDLNALIGPYAVFYLGPLAGNMRAGHNRGPLWSPHQWLELGRRIQHEMGLKIVLVGAPYDSAYFFFTIQPELREDDAWLNLIGDTNVGELYSITQKSRFIISYQSGVGIVSNYLGVPAGLFWRPKGDSIHETTYISFEEEMASAWANPEMINTEKHMPLIYGRHNVSYIMDEIKRRKW